MPIRRPIDLDPEFQGRVLPRHDLREPAFRRYEDLIAKAATQRQLLITLFDLPMGLTGRRTSCKTFCARFADAKLGYKRYHYKSYLVPKSFDVDNLIAYELNDATVVIRNYALSPCPLAPVLSSDHDTLLRIIKELPSWTSGSQMPVKVVSDIDLAWLRSLENTHHFVVSEKNDTDFVTLHYDAPSADVDVVIDDPTLAAELKAMMDGGNEPPASAVPPS